MCPLKEAARSAPLDEAVSGASFRKLDQIADRIAAELEGAGVKSGDCIAIRHPPCIEAIALFFAAWRLGASIAPLNLRYPASTVPSHLDRLGAKIYFDSFENPFVIRQTTQKLPSHGALLFTSGSTALPKIAFLSFANLFASASGAASFLGLREKDRWHLNLPLYHVGGIGIILRSILAKATIVLDPRDPGITHLSAVPTQLYRSTPLYPQLKCLLIGGAPISAYPAKLPCYLSYGLTEMGSIVTASFRPIQSSHPMDLGPPLSHAEIRIGVDQEIFVKGASLFQGYLENGEIRRPVDPDGWFATGDRGEITEGRLSFLGRKDWLFISGGENIQPEEIEAAILSFPGVQEAIVVPCPDVEFGQRPVAFLQTSLNDLSELKKKLMETLPKFKIPIAFHCLNELPRNGLKINRSALTQMVQKSQ